VRRARGERDLHRGGLTRGKIRTLPRILSRPPPVSYRDSPDPPLSHLFRAHVFLRCVFSGTLAGDLGHPSPCAGHVHVSLCILRDARGRPRPSSPLRGNFHTPPPYRVWSLPYSGEGSGPSGIRGAAGRRLRRPLGSRR